jgi:hypothetical protein
MQCNIVLYFTSGHRNNIFTSGEDTSENIKFLGPRVKYSRSYTDLNEFSIYFMNLTALQ